MEDFSRLTAQYTQNQYCAGYCWPEVRGKYDQQRKEVWFNMSENILTVSDLVTLYKAVRREKSSIYCHAYEHQEYVNPQSCLGLFQVILLQLYCLQIIITFLQERYSFLTRNM